MLTRADYNFIMKYGEVTPDGVAVYDLNSRTFVYINRFLREMLGISQHDRPQPGDDLLKYIHPDDLVYTDQRYRELLSIGCIGPSEFRMVHPKEGVRFLSVEVLWLEESYTFAIFAKDVTAMREYEDYVEKISAQKDTLLDMLLHNLSGPLYFSRDVLKVLAGGAAQNDEMSRLLTMVTETNGQCIDIIHQFLQEEHTESLSVVVRQARFNILEKSSIVINMLAEMNRNKKFSLQSTMGENYVISDAVKYCQVLHNLLSNSVKYTGDDAKITVLLEDDGRQTVVSVRDNGQGVPEELRTKLFKEKVQGIPGVKGEPSRGVGLYLCARLAKLIGGEISLDSTGPEGSVFKFTIPHIVT